MVQADLNLEFKKPEGLFCNSHWALKIKVRALRGLLLTWLVKEENAERGLGFFFVCTIEEIIYFTF